MALYPVPSASFLGLITDGAISGVGSGKSTSILSGVSRGGVSSVESGGSFTRSLRLGDEGRRGTSSRVE